MQHIVQIITGSSRTQQERKTWLTVAKGREARAKRNSHLFHSCKGAHFGDRSTFARHTPPVGESAGIRLREPSLSLDTQAAKGWMAAAAETQFIGLRGLASLSWKSTRRIKLPASIHCRHLSTRPKGVKLIRDGFIQHNVDSRIDRLKLYLRGRIQRCHVHS